MYGSTAFGVFLGSQSLKSPKTYRNCRENTSQQAAILDIIEK